MTQEKQNIEATIKTRSFFNGANFLKTPKLHRNNIFKRKNR